MEPVGGINTGGTDHEQNGNGKQRINFGNVKIDNLRSLLKTIQGLPLQFNILGDDPSGGAGDIGIDYFSEIYEKMGFVMFAPGRPDVADGMKDAISSLNTGDEDGADTASGKGNTNNESHLTTYDFDEAYHEYYTAVAAIFNLMLYHIGGDAAVEFRKFLNGGSDPGLVDSSMIQNYLANDIMKGYLPVESTLGKNYDYTGNILFAHDGPMVESDTFSNSIGDSALSAAAEVGNSAKIKEFNFYNNEGQTNDNTGFSNFIHKTVNVISGVRDISRLIVPKVWTGSEHNAGDVSYKFILSTPYGDSYSILRNVLLPLSMLLPFGSPADTPGWAKPPFLIKTYTKGGRSIIMGLMTSLTIEKNQEYCNAVGQPTRLDVTVNINELYDGVKIPAELDPQSMSHENYYFSNYLSALTGHNVTSDKGIVTRGKDAIENVYNIVSRAPNTITQAVKNSAIRKFRHVIGDK